MQHATTGLAQQECQTPLHLGVPNHIGVVVQDFDAAVEQHMRAFGCRMTPAQPITSDFWIEGEIRRLTFRIIWSVPGSPHVELIEQVPDSPWSAPGVHHYAYWVEDLAAAVERLQACGHVLEVTRRAEDGRMPFRFAYMRAPYGGCIELMDVAGRPGYEAWLRDGTPLVPPPVSN